MQKEQLELGFDGRNELASAMPRHGRRARAHWWFTQMHRVVDQAFDWRPAPLPRPEQRHLDLSPGLAGAPTR